METLIPDHDEAGKLIGFKYPYRRCASTFLGICRKWEPAEVKISGEDVEAQAQIRGGDWVLKRRQKP